MGLELVRLIELPKITDPRGNLTFIEGNEHIPFSIARTYWVYDVPAGGERGGHAQKNLDQLLIAASGSFDVVLDDGMNRKKITLNRPYIGLYLPKGIWRELENFSSGGVCLVLASNLYDSEDYIYDYNEFLRLRKNNR